jgi:hypothetical protein
MTKPLSEWLDNVHAGCMLATFNAVMNDNDAIVKEVAVDYLHTLLVQLKIDDVRRDILDRMAAQIAVEGLKPDYGFYKGLLP